MWQITLFKKKPMAFYTNELQGLWRGGGAGSTRTVKNGIKGALEVLGDERTD
jgi:hypothetical protein